MSLRPSDKSLLLRGCSLKVPFGQCQFAGLFLTEFNNLAIVRHDKMRVQRLSGMQKQVLSLYRGFLRVARSKSDKERHKIESIISEEFRRNSTEVDRKNFQYIEYLLRRGKKQLDQLRSPGTTGLTSLEVDLSRTNKTNS
ncbi:hypothetical protein Ahy_B01g051673 [Arachis hypogaea]|uniref:Complex 1 LYR protein domain-containing protein n=2 Tax=Arachis TaxID=3817 RepID=A0A445AMJ0_ARAHY|nr:hypothetical protein Ahy_B01g051673 [Arachis hypogaea]